MSDTTGIVTLDEDEGLLLIGVNRAQAHNLWNLEVIQAVSRAYRRLGDAEHLGVGVLHAHGRHFTAGLDLLSVAPLVASGDPRAVLPDDGYEPWNFFGDPCPKPIVVAAHGTCNTHSADRADNAGISPSSLRASARRVYQPAALP
jgi:enoyl-CoA hydratase/carnithine racemase